MSDTPRTPEEVSETVQVRGPQTPTSRESRREQPLPTPGQRLVGRYTVLSVLGEGGMGVVLAAYDERLDRRVALKLLRQGAESGELEARLVREAQAMARLNHPNVVAVYDSGRLEEGTFFIAMEYVEGRTLKDWSQQEQRPWSEVLGAYLQAGRGLAAAHAVGLIHRDFKPANVLVGQDERVRVMDFGVARVDASHSQHTPPTPMEAAPSAEAWETPLTLPGNVVGTPRYLAPELLKGQPADVRSDVFAFCVALYETLAGQHPFAGATVAERLRAQREGRLAPPPGKTEVPAWVWRTLARGLSAKPEQRPASMHALMALLEDDPEVKRRERWRGVALGGAALALVGLGAWGWVRGQGPGCEALAERRLEGVWDAPTKERVRAALVGTGLAYATDTARRVEAALDGYAGGWARMSQQVCEAAGTRAEQVRGLGVLKEACLERRRGQLRAVTELLGKGPDPELMPKAVQVVHALPPLEYCADEKALTAGVSPPEEPGLRARVDALQQKVDRLEALYEAGKYAQGLAEADPVLAEVEGLDFAPLKGRALLLVAQLREGTGEYKVAEERVRQAIALVARGGDTQALAKAWSLLMILVGSRQSRHQEALGMELALETVVELSRDERARAWSLNSFGVVLDDMGRYQEALAHYERALALREKTLGPEHPQVASSLNNLGIVLFRMGRYEEALAHYERALAVREKAQGPEHPHVAASLSNLGAVLQLLGRYEEALANQERALTLQEKTQGAEHPQVAAALNNLGSVLQTMGRTEEALTHYERALAVRQKALGPEHSEVALSHNSLGSLLQTLGRYEQALAHYERAMELRVKLLGPEHPDVAASLTGLGNVLYDMGRNEEALARQERALALYEKALGPEHPLVADTLGNLGNVLQALGRYEQALKQQERALALHMKALGLEHFHVAASLNNLGSALHAMGRNEEALAQLERALALLEKKVGPEHFQVAASLNNLGYVLEALGRHEEALPRLERALVLFEKALGPKHPYVSEPLLGLAKLHLARRSTVQAMPLLERALRLATGHLKAEAQLALARALWDSGEDRRRAVELATLAHAHWLAQKHPQQAETAQWLASHK